MFAKSIWCRLGLHWWIAADETPLFRFIFCGKQCGAMKVIEK